LLLLGEGGLPSKADGHFCFVSEKQAVAECWCWRRALQFICYHRRGGGVLSPAWFT